MVKALKTKINIFDKLKAKKIPIKQLGKAVSLPSDKGKYLGSCNRRECLRPNADWYNHSTRKFYCRECAEWLNCDIYNRRDALELYGHDLCTPGQPV